MGAPQSSILGPLAFITFINDLPNVVNHPSVHVYGDDTVLFLSTDNPTDISTKLHSDLTAVNSWLKENNLSLNVSKTKFMVYGTNAIRKRFLGTSLDLDGEEIEHVSSFKYLGVVFDEGLTWDEHIKFIHSKASSRLYLFRKLRHYLDNNQAKIVFTALVQSVMDYANSVW